MQHVVPVDQLEQVFDGHHAEKWMSPLQRELIRADGGNEFMTGQLIVLDGGRNLK